MRVIKATEKRILQCTWHCASENRNPMCDQNGTTNQLEGGISISTWVLAGKSTKNTHPLQKFQNVNVSVTETLTSWWLTLAFGLPSLTSDLKFPKIFFWKMSFLEAHWIYSVSHLLKHLTDFSFVSKNHFSNIIFRAKNASRVCDHVG